VRGRRAVLITTGQCDVVLVAAGGAGVHTDRTSTAPWTRPTNELVVGYGLFTAAESALMARRPAVREPEVDAGIRISSANRRTDQVISAFPRPCRALAYIAERPAVSRTISIRRQDMAFQFAAVSLQMAGKKASSPLPKWLLSGTRTDTLWWNQREPVSAIE